MRNLVTLILVGLCGCATVEPREYVTRQGDTLASIAEQRYGAPQYGVVVGYHNNLSAESLSVDHRLELPDLDEMVQAMSALQGHRDTVAELLRGRAVFVAHASDLSKARGKTPDGVDKAVPTDLAKALVSAAEALQSAEGDLVMLRDTGGVYPERLHTAILQTLDELRVHASGRYHTRRISVRQTERQVARIFAELLTWQRALSGEIATEKLAYPKCRCG